MKKDSSQIFDENAAFRLLKKHASNDISLEIVLKHSRAVQKLAMKLVDAFDDDECRRKKVDKEFIKVASLLHDIGRFRFAPKTGIDSLKHGIEGAKILKEEGWPDKYQKVCERHIGVGILKKDIIKHKLPLPQQNFVPETNEEKIIAYADNLVVGRDCRIVEEKDIVERYRKELSEEHAKRVIKFHDDIHKILKH